MTFGYYEQDNDLGNGEEAIEWLVLDVQDGKALVLSRYGLDAKEYNTELGYITWETCTLRSWLNGEFLNAAFSTEEQSAMLLSNVDNSVSQCYNGWNTNGGNNTQDKIFLLSYAEANKYFGVQHNSVSGAIDNVESRISPTAYAEAHGAYISDSNMTSDGTDRGWWWLRSPGGGQSAAALVYSDGSLRISNVRDGSGCVRPAFWIDLDSGIF